MPVKYEVVIGLEVHAQLKTQSKMYCRCSSAYADAAPNTHVCQICMGMPGVLPVINKQAVEYTMMTALALNCSISEYAKFDRKNYSYPDLMKGYQISQFDAPIGVGGSMTIQVGDEEKKIGITRVHLEEDVARLVHHFSTKDASHSMVDINRAGVPLMEVVGEPDLRSPEEARQYLMKLHSILRYLDVSTANMDEGSFRCDANISIRPVGAKEYGPKVEVKNMNSFRAVFKALEFEAKRQVQAAEAGERLAQETRGWVEESDKTVSLRSKEFAHDYRYFPEPDLPPLSVSRQWVEEVRAKLPELPEAKRDRFVSDFGLPLYDANIIISSKTMADYFEHCLQGETTLAMAKRAKTLSNWLLGEFSRLLNQTNTDISESKIAPPQLCQLVDLAEKGAVSGPNAKQVFEEMFNTGKSPSEIIVSKGLSQISDTGEVEQLIKQIIEANPQAVADYKAGKAVSLTFLVGQVMKATKGRANPKIVNDIMKKKLEE